MKKLLTMLLALAMCVSMIEAPAFAAEAGETPVEQPEEIVEESDEEEPEEEPEEEEPLAEEDEDEIDSEDAEGSAEEEPAEEDEDEIDSEDAEGSAEEEPAEEDEDEIDDEDVALGSGSDDCEHEYIPSYIYNGTSYTDDEWNDIFWDLTCQDTYTIRFTCSLCGDTDDDTMTGFHDDDYTFICEGVTYTEDEWFGNVYDTLTCADSYTEKAVCKICGNVYEETCTGDHDYVSSYIYNGTTYSAEEWESIADTLTCQDTYTDKAACSICGSTDETTCTGEHDYVTTYTCSGTTYTADEWESVIDTLTCQDTFTEEDTCSICGAAEKGTGTGMHTYVNTYVCGGNTYSEDEWESVYDTLTCQDDFTIKSVCSLCGSSEEDTDNGPHDYVFTYEYDGKTYTADEWESIYETVPCDDVYTEIITCSICGESDAITYVGHQDIVFTYDGNTYTFEELLGIADTLTDEQLATVTWTCSRCGASGDLSDLFSGGSSSDSTASNTASTNTGNTAGTSTASSPATGDNANIALYAGLSAAAAVILVAAAAYLIISKRKNSKKS